MRVESVQYKVIFVLIVEYLTRIGTENDLIWICVVLAAVFKVDKAAAWIKDILTVTNISSSRSLYLLFLIGGYSHQLVSYCKDFNLNQNDKFHNLKQYHTWTIPHTLHSINIILLNNISSRCICSTIN